MRSFQCHKRVKAAQIIGILPDMDAGTMTITCDDGLELVETLGKGIIARYEPLPGDYLVEYEDGYRSISPKKAFEDGYTEFGSVPQPDGGERPLLGVLSALSLVRVQLDAMTTINPRAKALVLTKLDEARLWAVDGENG